MADKTFASGFRFDLPRENAPSFVKGRISVHVGDAIDFLTKHRNERGFVNIDVLESRSGTLYCALNEWKSGGAQPSAPAQPRYIPTEDISPEDIPFS